MGSLYIPDHAQLTPFQDKLTQSRWIGSLAIT